MCPHLRQNYFHYLTSPSFLVFVKCTYTRAGLWLEVLISALVFSSACLGLGCCCVSVCLCTCVSSEAETSRIWLMTLFHVLMVSM